MFKDSIIVDIFGVYKKIMTRELKISVIKILSLVVIIALISLVFNHWYRILFDALTNKDVKKTYIILTLWLIAGIVFSGIKAWLKKIELSFAIDTREALYKHFGAEALSDEKCSVPCQRMSSDLQQFGRQSVAYVTLALYATIQLPIFCFLVWSNLNIWIMLAIVSYAAISAKISKRIAKPIVNLEYIQETLEGELRRELVAQVKNQDKQLPKIDRQVTNYKKLISKEIVLEYFVSVYNIIGHLFPYFLGSFMLFAGRITFGQLTQLAHSFDRILDAVSFFINNRQMIVDLRNTIKRIHELG